MIELASTHKNACQLQQLINDLQNHPLVQEIHMIDENRVENKFLLLKDRYQSYCFAFEDILYIRAINNYALVIDNNGGQHCFAKTLKDIEQLCPNCFFRVHRSYLVNIRHIRLINKQYLVLSNEHQIPISRIYKKQLEQILQSEASVYDK